ncbi:hypothetical protein IC582_017071 [Cucumis melo]|uniref:Pentatricopeptide repeat-containing protein At4g36680, mitochondrial n=1 Tax=Cucumis melo TaxID=3656 RepID=A0A1S3BX19_CUCME|nr:pentatricopeptide repeat-containing protein At4g36680, mitochondrial [Cucumis melo]
MSFSISTRHHIRRLSTAATAAATNATETTSSSLSISKAKSKLRNEYDPDKALEIYSSVSSHYTSPVTSRYAQEITIRRLAKSRRFKDIESLIESHKNDPKITQEPFLSTLIRSYGRVGMFEHAMRTYNQMGDLGTPRSALSFNALLSACNHSKQFDKVPQLFDEMPKRYNFSPNKISYGILVKSYCDAGSPEKALQILREMEENDVEVTAVTFTTIINALYKKGESAEAEKIWDKMISKGCELDVGAYNVRLMHEHGGKPERVQAIIEEMANSGLKPDAISYNYLMTCYCKNGMIDEAKKVYNDMEINGCNKNAATFRTFIYHLCRNGEYEKGYKVFKESVKMNKIPDFNTLKYLVEGLVEKKMMREAKGLIRTVRKKFPPDTLKAWREVEEGVGLASAGDDVSSKDDNVSSKDDDETKT